MEFFCASVSDRGTKRADNQDAVRWKQYFAGFGQAVFSVLCDGMGGLKHGEIASASVAEAFSKWADNYFSDPNVRQPEDYDIRREWTAILSDENEKLRQYGLANGFSIGTTATALLLTPNRYYIMNIGDSRAYCVSRQVTQLTEDHTLIAEEIRKGNLNEEQAAASPIRNMLTRCVGAMAQSYPDFFFGETEAGASYVLCSDGFRHKIVKEELRECLLPRGDTIVETLERGIVELIERNKARGETDNITAAVLYVKA